MRTHRVQSWVIAYDDRPCDVVYDQRIALERWSRPNGRTMELVVRERVCVLDRPDAGSSTCYMCEREKAAAS